MLYTKTSPLLCMFLFFTGKILVAQTKDSGNNVLQFADTAAAYSPAPKTKLFHFPAAKNAIYPKPKAFGFFTSIPADAVGMTKTIFENKTVKPLACIGGATLLLLLADEPVANAVKKISRNINVSAEEDYQDIITLKLGASNVSIFKAPKNINTAFYQMGQGFPSLLIGTGLFAYGKIKKDYRALSTASQLAEAFILMGVSTQVLKRITGRQSPSRATDKGGRWHFFPSVKQYQGNTPNYDAFPSGHLATLMSSVTILAENYPEKKYIKPVGYSLIGLVGLSMINTDVHWVSDYPLALGLGYLCAMQVVKHNRKILPVAAAKQAPRLSCSLAYQFGKIMPALKYSF